MKTSSLLVAVLLSSLFAAGCFSNGDGSDQPTGDSGNGPEAPANVTAPTVSARATLDELREYASAYPYRVTGSPTMAAARDDLALRFEASGLEVVRQDFSGGGQNILGIKWGSDRDHWIVIGAHYDITEGAVHGTYDDGSGTAQVFMLAQAFAAVNTTRTIVFAEFDQEELGLIGSSAFIEAVQGGTFPYDGEIDGMIDLDMAGITWPHPAHLIVWENSAALTAKIQELAAQVGFPPDHVEFRNSNIGSSDGAAFINAGIATAYFFSDWDEYYLPDGSVMPSTPVPYVGQYPWWHKTDTYDTMVVSAGDEATLEAGFQNLLDVVSPLLLYMTTPEFMSDAAEDES